MYIIAAFCKYLCKYTVYAQLCVTIVEFSVNVYQVLCFFIICAVSF